MYYIRSVILAGLLAPLPFGVASPLLNSPILETAPDLPYTWQYKGCYIDRVGNRALKKAATSDGEMTGGLCARWCSEQGYNLAGTEWGRECYCGYDLNRPVLTSDIDCSFPCTGWPTEACGGSQRLTVYETVAGEPPKVNPGVPGFPSLGCYTDSIVQRALPVKATYDGGLDVAKCAAACSSLGYTLAGVEYGYECYCGNALENGSRLIAGEGSTSGCDYECTGDRQEFCGGSNRMNLYGQFSAVPSSTPSASSTDASSSTPAPSSTPVATPEPSSEVTPPASSTTPEVLPTTSETPAVDTPSVVQIPTSETPTPEAPTSTPVAEQPATDASSSSSTTTPASTPTADVAPVDPVVGAAV